MPQLPIRRHLPCTMLVEVLPSPAPHILRVDFRLAMPTFGFDLTAQALLSAEVLDRSPDRDGLLVAIGRDALSRALGAMANQGRLAPFTVPTPPPPTPQERMAALDDDLAPTGQLSSSDKEMLRAFKISPD